MPPLPAMMNLRLSTLLLVIAAIAAFAGCGKAPTPPEAADATNTTDTEPRVRIGFLVQQPDGPWQQQRKALAQQAADDLGFELIDLPIPDRDATLAAIDRLVELGAGGMVISTPDTDLGYELAQRARAADLKVLSVDHSLVGANGLPHGVPHIGFDDAKIGQTAATVLDAAMRVRGWRSDHLHDTAVVVLSDAPSDSTRARVHATLHTLAEARFPSAQVFHPPPPEPGDTSENPTGTDAAAVLLRQHTDIRHWGVIGTNDQLAISALQRFRDAGVPAGDVIGVGCNGIAAIGAFRDESSTDLHASLLLSPRAHGYDAAAAMYHWVAQGAKPDAQTLTAVRLIDRRNFEQAARDAGLE